MMMMVFYVLTSEMSMALQRDCHLQRDPVLSTCQNVAAQSDVDSPFVLQYNRSRSKRRPTWVDMEQLRADASVRCKNDRVPYTEIAKGL
jgi:hypothetical protein